MKLFLCRQCAQLLYFEKTGNVGTAITGSLICLPQVGSPQWSKRMLRASAFPTGRYPCNWLTLTESAGAFSAACPRV